MWIGVESGVHWCEVGGALGDDELGMRGGGEWLSGGETGVSWY